MRFRVLIVTATAAIAVASVLGGSFVAAAPGANSPGTTWSVQYLIDNSQPADAADALLGGDQLLNPRSNRGLAISPDGKFLYAGYNNASPFFEVRKIDLSQPDYTLATVHRLVNKSRG